MNKRISVLFLLLSAFSSPLLSESIAITGAKIHTMTGSVLEKGTILIRDGKIEAVGSAIQIPAGYRTIDASGKSVYPGFIDGNCHVGLTEISQVASTVDESESVDPVTPQMRVTDALFLFLFPIVSFLLALILLRLNQSLSEQSCGTHPGTRLFVLIPVACFGSLPQGHMKSSCRFKNNLVDLFPGELNESAHT